MNPHGRRPLPPQDSVSTRFHHFGTVKELSFFRILTLRLLSNWRRGVHTFHNGRGCPLSKKKGQKQGRHHKNHGSRRCQLTQKRARPRTSENRLAGAAKGRPHIRTLTPLKKYDQDKRQANGHMYEYDYKFHLAFVLSSAPEKAGHSHGRPSY